MRLIQCGTPSHLAHTACRERDRDHAGVGGGRHLDTGDGALRCLGKSQEGVRSVELFVVLEAGAQIVELHRLQKHYRSSGLVGRAR